MQSKNELVFELKGIHPDRLPLARLAAYMKEFATLLGGSDKAMFSGVREGSTCIAAKLSSGEISTARNRLYRASKSDGSAEAVKAFVKLADMANRDRLAARVIGKAGTVVHFPRGRNARARLSVFERGQITGRLSGIVDDRNGATARIRPMEGGPLVYASAENKMADGLGKFFRRHVRVYGPGEWTRDDEGRWFCIRMKIDEIHAVEDVSIRQAVDAMRELDVEWTDNPFEDFDGVSTA